MLDDLHVKFNLTHSTLDKIVTHIFKKVNEYEKISDKFSDVSSLNLKNF